MSRRKNEPKLLADRSEIRARLRRWLRFYLATAVILAVSFGVHFGIPVYRQQQVLDEIARLGGWAGARQGGPVWLREKIGHERMKGFDEIRAISVDGKEFTDAALARLTILRSLRWLSLANTQITDAGLAHLKKLPNLETLRLNDTQVTDAGLNELAALQNLRDVQLAGTQVTDAGVAELKKALPQVHVQRWCGD
jgi:Leucine-rich repeat (LRR) protein